MSLPERPGSRQVRPPTAAAAAAVAFLVTACGQPPAAPPPVRIGVHGDPVSLDPHGQAELLSLAILGNVHEALTVLDREIKLGPALAESWESPDDLTWRFRLRPDARFHDGRAVEAEDVVASLARARRVPGGGVGSYVVAVASSRALGPRTVEVVTTRPFAGLLNKLAVVAVVPRDAPAPLAAPVGNGPYRVSAYEKGRRLRLDPVAGPGLPADLPPLEFFPLRDPAERTERLLRGELDLVQDLSPDLLPQVEAAKGYRVAVTTSPVVEFLHFSRSDPRFADPRVREAFDLALDRAALVRNAFRGRAQPATQIVGPGVFGYDPSIPARGRDLARARSLLADAGYAGGLDVRLEYRQGRDAAEIARQLGEAGIRVTPVAHPWPPLFARLSARSVPFYYGGVAAPSADASDIFDSFVHSPDPARGYGGTNHSGYSNPEVDRLVERIGETRSLRERQALLQQGMRLLAEDRWILPLVIPYDLYGVTRDLAWEPRLDRRLFGAEMRWSRPRKEAAGS
ncbi:MAG: hypothetical protein EDX89_00240 [Acidobacteria bacterium]|nr:MAG: hypothetical protein EDX89_00240 [Acidobacteriota bacterium]